MAWSLPEGGRLERVVTHRLETTKSPTEFMRSVNPNAAGILLAKRIILQALKEGAASNKHNSQRLRAATGARLKVSCPSPPLLCTAIQEISAAAGVVLPPDPEGPTLICLQEIGKFLGKRKETSWGLFTGSTYVYDLPQEIGPLADILYQLVRGPMLGVIAGHPDERALLQTLFLKVFPSCPPMPESARQMR